MSTSNEVRDLQFQLDACREDNLFLRKRRIELRKQVFQLIDQVTDLKREVGDLQFEIDSLLKHEDKEAVAADVESQFPPGFFPPVK